MAENSGCGLFIKAKKTEAMNKTWIVLLLLAIGCKNKSQEQLFLDYINSPKNKITQQIKIGETEATLKLLTDEYRNFSKRDQEGNTDERNNGYYYFNMKLVKTKEKSLKKKKYCT